METRTIRVYKSCENCGGTGIETSDIGTFDCDRCQGMGEVLEMEKKDVIIDELKLSTGRD